MSQSDSHRCRESRSSWRAIESCLEEEEDEFYLVTHIKYTILVIKQK